MKEAILYHRAPTADVVCDLCAHRCRIREGYRGVCGVRVNTDGKLYTLVYDRVAAIEIDPVEKKPFYHFRPGSTTLSIATVGCNMRCLYCQNYLLSQLPKRPGEELIGCEITPEEILTTARARHCAAIAYTYTEPTIFFELAFDTARLARSEGIKNLFVTNGYLTAEAIDLIHPYLDGVNVDLKGFDQTRYRKLCGARLRPVLENIERVHDLGIWLEVTTLVIPGYNDSNEELRGIAGFLADMSYSIPWHVTAFFPAHTLRHLGPTPVETLHRAYDIGRSAGLRYVYCGNIPGDIWASTYCYQCHSKLIDRSGFTLLANWIVDGTCPHCGARIEGVEMNGHSEIPGLEDPREATHRNWHRFLSRAQTS